jgi:hypothetical protein
MNYIKHLTGFFDKVVPDHRLNPTHISLYLSLFQYWNINRFQNPISISRDEVMRVSKICSKATYHKCMRELHDFGYIRYAPSYNPFKGSLVYLEIFDTDQKTDNYLSPDPTDSRTSIGTSTGTGTEQALVPSINYINSINNNNIYSDGKNSEEKILAEESNSSQTEDSNPAVSGQNEKRKKAGGLQPEVPLQTGITLKKEKEPSVKPTLNEAIAFFRSENYPELEAKKFFNHFESNGWKVGGKAPMKDWHAAARNWMLNSKTFNPHPKPNNTTINLNTPKNYGEPL